MIYMSILINHVNPVKVIQLVCNRSSLEEFNLLLPNFLRLRSGRKLSPRSRRKEWGVAREAGASIKPGA